MQDYNTIIGSIQMRLNGCQTRSVMDRYKIGSGTLNLIMSRYHANGIPIEELRMMAPKEVEDLFYPQKNIQRKDIPLPDFQYYYDRIHTPGSRMNISFCWLDYKEKNPDGYEKSQFYEYFNCSTYCLTSFDGIHSLFIPVLLFIIVFFLCTLYLPPQGRHVRLPMMH